MPCFRFLTGTAIALSLSLTAAQAQLLNFAPLPAPAPIFQSIMPPTQQPMQIAPQAPQEQIVEEQNAAPVPDHLRRQTVSYRGREAPGTIIVDTPNTYLYYVLGGGKAIRYG